MKARGLLFVDHPIEHR